MSWRAARYAVAALAMTGLVAAPAAHAEEQVAASGDVQATFSFVADEYAYTDFHLAIDRGGQRLFDAPLDICCSTPSGLFEGKDAVHVQDLDGDGEPEVWVDIFTGGAHCCTDSHILRFDGSAYQLQTRNWFDSGYRLIDPDADGIPEFKSADSFKYAFAPFSGSPFVVRVYTYRAGAFTDVTSQHPALVRKDLRRVRRMYRRGIRNHVPSLGWLAGWTADDYTLGHRKRANRRLTRELRAGHLYADPGWHGGVRFIRHLKQVLRRAGY